MRILAITDLRGATYRLPQVLDLINKKRIDAVVFSGNIIEEDARYQQYVDARARGESAHLDPDLLDKLEKKAVAAYEAFFDDMGKLDIPVFVVPGELDAPKRLYYQAALNHEVIEPNVFMVHRSFSPALENYNLAIAGFGGRIAENNGEWEVELAQIYPHWLPVFALDFVRHFDQEPILIFHTPPKWGELDTHGDRHIGHEAIDHVIKTYHPKYAFVGAARDGQGTTRIGTTLVINPGWLKDGHYAILDTRTNGVLFGQFTEVAGEEALEAAVA